MYNVREFPERCGSARMRGLVAVGIKQKTGMLLTKGLQCTDGLLAREGGISHRHTHYLRIFVRSGHHPKIPASPSARIPASVHSTTPL